MDLVQLAFQMDLPRARKRDPRTSHAAAKTAGRAVVGRAREVLAILAAYGPANHTEVDDRLRWRNNTAVRLWAPLRRRGFVEVVAERPTCTTGCDAQVYGITERGRQALKEGPNG